MLARTDGDGTQMHFHELTGGLNHPETARSPASADVARSFEARGRCWRCWSARSGGPPMPAFSRYGSSPPTTTRITLEGGAELRFTQQIVKNPAFGARSRGRREFNSLRNLGDRVSPQDPYIKLIRAGRTAPAWCGWWSS